MGFKAKESLAEQVARHLAQEIITGELLAGDRIQEQRYAKELDVSRGTVREALLILERWYLIEILPRRGAVVADMSEDHVNSLYEMLEVMLILIVRKAMRRAREEEFDLFIALIQEMQGYVDNRLVEEFQEASFRFLGLLAEYADNYFMEDVMHNLQPAVKRSYYLALHIDRGEMKQSLTFFKALLESMLRKDEQVLMTVLENFVDHQRSLVLESIMRERQLEVAWAQRYRR